MGTNFSVFTVDGGKNMAGLKKVWSGGSYLSWKIFVSEKLFFCTVFTSASTLFETFGYFLRDETNRLGGEIHSESRINLPPILDFS